jgi:hypothetical protein
MKLHPRKNCIINRHFGETNPLAACASLRFLHHAVIDGRGLRPDHDLTPRYNVVAIGADGFGFGLAVRGAIPKTRPRLILIGLAMCARLSSMRAAF